MKKLEIKNRAISLRRRGKTYSEIQKILGPLPKSTLSGWLKKVELTKSQKKRIQQKIIDRGALGRQRGGWSNHQKRLTRISAIQLKAREEYASFSNNQLFLVGIALYSAEGSRKTERFQFMNSDPFLVKIMLKWIRKFDPVSFKNINARLYVHKIYSHENHEKFWSDFLNIAPAKFQKTIFKPTLHKVKKNPEYRGCLRIETSGSELYWKMMEWRKMLYANI